MEHGHLSMVTQSQKKTTLLSMASSLHDVRVYSGAECASDHTLVLEVISLNLRKTRKGQPRGKHIDSDKLRNIEIQAAYSKEIQNRNRFHLLHLDHGEGMNLDTFDEVLREIRVVIVGFKCKKKEERMRSNTSSKLEERKEMKQRINSTKSVRVKD